MANNNSNRDPCIDLWSRFRSGDDAAFEAVYVQNFDLLLRYGAIYEHDVEVVKDALQEIFVKLYNTRTALNESGNIKSYLLVALRNKLFDRKKNKKISSTVSIDIYPDFVISEDEFDTNLSDDDSYNVTKVKGILNTLTPKQKQIIHLRFVENLSFKEISEILHIENQSAKNSIARSIEKIKKEFFK